LFDADRRAALKGQIGVEIGVLLSICDAAGGYPVWAESGIATELDDSGRKGAIVYAAAAMTVGQGSAKKMMPLMSPLVFWTSYRCLDMLFEWLIRENEDNCPSGFEAKRKLLANRLSTYRLPSSLKPGWVKTLFDLYDKLLEFRHALTHRQWGKRDESGNLCFGFQTKQGETMQQTVTWTQVIDMAFLVAKIAELLVEDRMPDMLGQRILTWLEDRVQPIIGAKPQGLLPPLRTRVQYTLTQTSQLPAAVDLGSIRDYISSRNSRRDCIIDLRLVANLEGASRRWYIPAESLPEEKTLRLDEAWDSFLLKQ